MTRSLGHKSTYLQVIGTKPLELGRRALFRMRISGPLKRMTVSQILPLPIGVKVVLAVLNGLEWSIATMN